MPYTQLTKDERYVITHLNNAGISYAEIARQLGRHRATIGREIKRNLDSFRQYHYEPAQRQAQTRATQANQRYKLDEPDLKQSVLDGLKKHWSPEQIAGRLRRKYPKKPSSWITHEAIYQWIYREHTQGNDVYTCLRKCRSRRRNRLVGKRKSNIPNRVGIEKRPKIVDSRSRHGDWESDTVEGQKGTGVLMTHVDRKSRFLVVGKLPNKQANTLSEHTCQHMKDLPACLRRTMTADNGTEFTQFNTIESVLSLKVYFANPHSPWERGTNENMNGQIREFFPKGTDFRTVSDAEVAKVQSLLNNRPRKCLNFRTPLEVLNALPGVALRN